MKDTSEAGRTLSPALSYATAKLQEAFRAFLKLPDERNALRVIDTGRFCLNVGLPLAAEAGQSTRPWSELYDSAADFLREHKSSTVLQFPPSDDKLNLLIDVVYELQRDVGELKAKRRVVRIVESEVAA